ncbi:SRPBCC family protein [Kribbella jejuensis]|uniref:Polyketide cyclase/dehydrase/lipid transport protein n=1 Tax=Kribbella jejuensis TaxID=236068 RepID=A0A542ELM4_9ACTN|nr:SRPBCC family protein [Kribbella jejuensis]TQJ16241.1 polyketide cyclase/dehydrase/lipid transport protein [Kribbella jejuensis]
MESITESVDVRVPLEIAYAKWRDISSFPQYMDGVHDVRELDGIHSHWVASAGGFVREFDATIVEQQPGRRITWVCESGLMLGGSVTFESRSEDRTAIAVELRIDPQGLIENLAEKTGILHRMVVADLYRFKNALEAADPQQPRTKELHTP